ncbi:MAG: TolC family protein, partial [Halanaerobium sp.]
YEKSVEEQIFSLIQSYYGVLQAEAMVEIREEALTTVKEHLRVVENNLEAGTAIRQDLLQSQIEQRRAEEELTVAENDLKIARRRLAQLLVSDQQYSVRDLEPDFDFSLERNKLYDLAVENNSELLVLELNRKITELNKKLDGEYYRPNVNLNGSYNWEGEEFLEDESWSLTAAVTVPLYDGGSGKIKAEQIDKELEKLKNSRQNMLENIDIELEDVLLTVEENKEKIDLEKLSLENAEENLEIANNSYESGVAANTEVIDAQATYNQARIALMQAEYNYEIELFRTLFESGQLREYFEDVVEDEN